MSLFSDPPTTTKYSFKRGDYHIGVWALQRFFNGIDYDPMTEDGSFGPQTEAAVKRYQNSTGASVDGIVGPQTQARIVRSCVVRAPYGQSLPKGLIEGQIDLESGRYIAAVNSKISGGLDLGLTQRRVKGPPYNEAEVAAAFDPLGSVARSVNELYSRYAVFKTRVAGNEYAWRLAALAHNWPYAAEEISRGRKLSTTREATWAGGAKFDDGAQVFSWHDWAGFYAMGTHAHRHPGSATRLAFGIPSYS